VMEAMIGELDGLLATLPTKTVGESGSSHLDPDSLWSWLLSAVAVFEAADATPVEVRSANVAFCSSLPLYLMALLALQEMVSSLFSFLFPKKVLHLPFK